MRENVNHLRILIEGVFFQDPISLQAEFDIPECSKGIGHSKVKFLSESMTFGESPKLNKRSHKLNLVSLSTNMCQADHQVILQQTLNDNVSIYTSQVEVNGQSIDHVKSFNSYKVV